MPSSTNPWMTHLKQFRKAHPSVKAQDVMVRARASYYAKRTPSRSRTPTRKSRTPTRKSRTPTRKSRTPSRSMTPKRTPRVCRLYSTPKGKSPRHCLKFRTTPKRHCSKFSKGKSPKKCIRYSRTPVKR